MISLKNGVPELTSQCIQIDTSPYRCQADFRVLKEACPAPARIDCISIADILRNAFVYPPHSIFEQVKVAPCGVDPAEDLSRAPSYHFDYGKRFRPATTLQSVDTWIDSYHRRLCEVLEDVTAPLRSPWLLQSGGKDSTSLAIGLAEVRPDVTCLTYLGGMEENEISSARHVAKALGLHHEYLVCQPGRAYDRYLDLVLRLPLL